MSHSVELLVKNGEIPASSSSQFFNGSGLDNEIWSEGHCTIRGVPPRYADGPPKPPPCRPFLGGGATRCLSGREKVCCAVGFVRDEVCTPQRTQRSRERSTPTAAADSGSRVSDASIHAQTFSVCVICARKEIAREVRPKHSRPTISVTAPNGNPPSSNSLMP